MAEQFVDVTYSGLEVGHRLKLSDFGPRTAYLELTTPMPVGTALELVGDDGAAVGARVIRVHEQVAGADLPPGMRVEVADAPGWWQPLVERDDPTIPEPPTRPAEPAVEAAPAAEQAEPAPEQAEAAPEQAEAPPAEDGAVLEPADSSRQTTVMSTAAIEAAVAEIEGAAAAGDGTRTRQMSAVAIEEALAAEDKATASSDDKDDGDDGGNARGKRKRRRRKRKTRGS